MDYQTTVSVNENEKKETKKRIKKAPVFNQKPTSAFIGASWFALATGIVSYCIGLWNANMLLNEKGYYFTILLFALFSVISVQKSVRDKLEGVPVTDIYYRMSWFTSIISILLLIIGLRNADLELSEKGFYAMSFLLSIFSAIAVQKNTRDLNYIENNQNEDLK